MKRIIVVTLAIVLMLIPLIGVNCGSDGDNDIGIAILPEGYTWFMDDEFGYKIAYPEGWTVISQEEEQLSEGMYYSQHIVDTDGFANIWVTVNAEFDLDWMEDSGAKEVSINGRKGYYEDELSTPPQSSIQFKFKVAVFLIEGKYWAVTCQTSPLVWDEYAGVFDTAIRSFVIE